MALIVNSKLVVIHYFGTKHNPKFTWIILQLAMRMEFSVSAGILQNKECYYLKYYRFCYSL